MLKYEQQTVSKLPVLPQQKLQEDQEESSNMHIVAAYGRVATSGTGGLSEF